MKRLLLAACVVLMGVSVFGQGAPPTYSPIQRVTDSTFRLVIGGSSRDSTIFFRRGAVSTDTLGITQSSPTTNEWYRFHNLIFPHDSQTSVGLAPPPHYYQAYLGYNGTNQRWEPIANPWLRISPNTGDDNVAALYWYPYDTLNQIIGTRDFEIALDTNLDAFIMRSGTDTIKILDPFMKVLTLVATDSIVITGSGSGQLQLSGSSSGIVTLTTQTDAGTYTITVPSTGPLALGADTLCWGYDNSSTGGWQWYPCGNSSGGGGGGAAGPWNANANTTSNSLMYFGGSATDTAFTVRDSTTDNVKTTVTAGENPYLQLYGKDSTTVGKSSGVVVIDSAFKLQATGGSASTTITKLIIDSIYNQTGRFAGGGGGGSGDLTAFGSDLTGDVLADSAGAHATWFGSGTNRGFSISNTGGFDRWRLSEHLIIGDTSGVQARLGTSPSLWLSTDSQNVSIHGGIFHNNASVNSGTGVSWTVSGAAGYDPLIAVTNRTGSGFGFYREYGATNAGDLFWQMFSSASFPYTTSSTNYFWKVESDISSMTFRPLSFVNFNFNADSGLVVYRDTVNDTTKLFAPSGTLQLGNPARVANFPAGIQLGGDSAYTITPYEYWSVDQWYGRELAVSGAGTQFDFFSDTVTLGTIPDSGFFPWEWKDSTTSAGSNMVVGSYITPFRMRIDSLIYVAQSNSTADTAGVYLDSIKIKGPRITVSGSTITVNSNFADTTWLANTYRGSAPGSTKTRYALAWPETNVPKGAMFTVIVEVRHKTGATVLNTGQWLVCGRRLWY